VSLVSAGSEEVDLFCRQQLGKHPQPLQVSVGALAPVVASVLGSRIWQNQPPQRECVHPVPVGQVGAERGPQVGVGKAAGTAEGMGGEGGCWVAADVYVGQREPAGAWLWLVPGFRECGFSRLTGGQWAGSRAGGGPGGVLGPP